MYRFLPEEERFLGLDDGKACPEKAGVVVVCVPYEKTSSYRSGSVKGPSAILSASHQIELFDAHLACEPWQMAGGIATLSPLQVDDCKGGEAMARRVERVVDDWLAQGKKVVTVAGEHTGVVGAIRAHVGRNDSLTVLQLDAHSDMRNEYLADPWNHACTMARVLDFHDDVVQAGIRSEAKEERALVEKRRIPVFRGESIPSGVEGFNDWIGSIVGACSQNVYVTFDCDVLDPSVMPATGTPEPGGLTWGQANQLLALLCRERNVVGFDISELAPIAGVNYPEFTVAKLVYRLMGLMFCGDCRSQS